MKKYVLTMFFMVYLAMPAYSVVRLKDVATINDQRATQLIGYGLVVGLDGTGDGKNTQFTIRSIGNLIQNLGIDVPATSIKVKNVAAVMVTATVSPYVKKNRKFDVTVSSMGDATSLEGGMLILTQLTTGDFEVYGMAQGPVSVGGTNKDFGSPGGLIENAQLVGRVPGGGILDRELPTLDMGEENLLVTVRDPDYTTVFRLSEAINDYFGRDIALSQDAGSIIVKVPENYSDSNNIVSFISEMELVTFMPDDAARVIINERTGTIIAGGNLTLGPIAIMHGNLSLAINEAVEEPLEAAAIDPAAPVDPTAPVDPAAVAPVAPVLPGAAPVGDRMIALDTSANVGEVAKALNMLGVTPRDLIAIFQALSLSGSLRAELIVM